jgi:hypothetical protein
MASICWRLGDPGPPFSLPQLRMLRRARTCCSRDQQLPAQPDMGANQRWKAYPTQPIVHRQTDFLQPANASSQGLSKKAFRVRR